MMYESSYSNNLCGIVDIPGDKSISHRALMFGALAEGCTQITGILEGEDVLATASIVEALGARVRREEGIYYIDGVGTQGFRDPLELLDCGNSGTSMRLLAGLLAGQNISGTLVGDCSLSKRPMGRILEPLKQMGAEIEAKDGRYTPLVLSETSLKPIVYELPVASAQVKSCVLLAGLGCDGVTQVIETEKSRDHTEKMLQAFGADLKIEDVDGKVCISVQGRPALTAQQVVVPSDPSSAGFFIVAALITKGSEIKLPNVMLNKTRTGLITTLLEMGGNIDIQNQRMESGEEVGDLIVRSSVLKSVEVPAKRAVSMIDEYPILSVAAACAQGETVMQGIGELRVKEADRIAAMEEGLNTCGVVTRSTEDSLTVVGGADISPQAVIQTYHDHRIAMSFLTLGLVSERSIVIDDVSMIKTSFPNFIDLMTRCGAQFKPFTKGGVS